MRQEHETGGKTGGGMKSPGTRANAVWGKGRKRYALLLALAVVAAAAVTGTTTAASPPPPPVQKAHVSKDLKDEAEANPTTTFPVIIEASAPDQLHDVDNAVDKTQKKKPGKARGVRREFRTIGAVSAELTGAQVTDLASQDGIEAITNDSETHATAYSNPQEWPATVAAQWGDVPRGARYPTIAVIDSGVQGRGDFGTRLVRQVEFVDQLPTKGGGGDAFGHGTMVAGLAIGGSDGHTGTEPRGKVVSLDVLDNNGNGRVSAVLAACDWILQNKDRYDIRVANFSINAGSGAGVANDPLNKAVEKLWLNGVVVVTAAGNYALDGAASGVGFAPANDPFVITVGASDTNGTAKTSDDFAAPWSAWGLTQDGFRKPELAAPGRVMNGPVPPGSTLLRSFPTRKLDGDYMWMSGTSFAAPIVSGAAATILSRHPDWTPDQVKGALMSAVDVPTGYDSSGSLGVGILDIANAVSADGKANPNAALNRFVTTDSNGLKTFDANGWMTAAMADAAWNAASWSSASWSSASWSSASWSSASWSSASWSSASWSSASWSSASWSSASWSSASWSSMFEAP